MERSTGRDGDAELQMQPWPHWRWWQEVRLPELTSADRLQSHASPHFPQAASSASVCSRTNRCSYLFVWKHHRSAKQRANDTSARRALVARDLAAHGALADGGAPARTPSLHHAIAGWQPGARKRMTASSLTVLGVGFRLRITLISS
jgi:hypothetical protein